MYGYCVLGMISFIDSDTYRLCYRYNFNLWLIFRWTEINTLWFKFYSEDVDIMYFFGYVLFA